jgi:hypothetical protein
MLRRVKVRPCPGARSVAVAAGDQTDARHGHAAALGFDPITGAGRAPDGEPRSEGAVAVRRPAAEASAGAIGPDLAAGALGVAMFMPTFLFFLPFGPAAQAGSLAFFVLALALLAPHVRFDGELGTRLLLLVGGATVPLALSVVVHINDYSLPALVTALGRIAGLAVYLTTITAVLATPEPGRVLTRAMVTLTWVLVVFSLAVAIVDPRWDYGRFSPGGPSPQWWAEIFMAVTFGAAFVSRRLLRYALWTLALTGLLLVQSRNGLGTSLLIIGFATLQHEGFKRLLLLGVVTVFVAGPVLLLVDVAVLDNAIFGPLYDWIVNSVLLLNHEQRGLGSGFTNRDDTWMVALELIATHTWLGVGFARSDEFSLRAVDLLVHNGHLALMADLGVLLYAVLAVIMFGAILRSLVQRNWIALGLLVPFAFFAMMLKPRGINMSIVPMLFWMWVGLAWLRPLRAQPVESAAATAVTTAPPAGAPARRPIGYRWSAAATTTGPASPDAFSPVHRRDRA